MCAPVVPLNDYYTPSVKCFEICDYTHEVCYIASSSDKSEARMAWVGEVATSLRRVNIGVWKCPWEGEWISGHFAAAFHYTEMGRESMIREL